MLKMLQIMTEKRLVVRDESERAHVYQARAGEEQTCGLLIGDLVERAFDGSASRLVMQALGSQPTSSEDLAEIRRLINEIETNTTDDTEDDPPGGRP